jgi:hypothetical protein
MKELTIIHKVNVVISSSEGPPNAVCKVKLGAVAQIFNFTPHISPHFRRSLG